MLQAPDYRAALTFARRLMASVSPRQRGAWEVLEWVDDHEEFLGFGLRHVAYAVEGIDTGLEEMDDDVLVTRMRSRRKRGRLYDLEGLRGVLMSSGRRTQRTVLDAALGLLDKAAARERGTATTGLDQTCQALGRLFGLSTPERELLRLFVLSRMVAPLGALIETVRDHQLLRLEAAVAAALSMPETSVTALLDPSGRLLETGLLVSDHDDVGLGSGACATATTIEVASVVLGLVQSRARKVPALRRRLVGARVPAELELGDFDHLARDRDLAVRLLEEAGAADLPGLNILLYGPPGTGKTEFAKCLAEAAGLDLFAVGELEVRRQSAVRARRLTHLRQLQALLRGNGECALLFDEMEDLLGDTSILASLFGARRAPTGQKAQVHTLIEGNPVPVIWTCNDLDGFDPALLRRMTMAIEVPVPPARARLSVWNRTAARAGLELSPTDLSAIARDLPRRGREPDRAPVVGRGADLADSARPAAAVGWDRGGGGPGRRPGGGAGGGLSGRRVCSPDALTIKGFRRFYCGLAGTLRYAPRLEGWPRG